MSLDPCQKTRQCALGFCSVTHTSALYDLQYRSYSSVLQRYSTLLYSSYLTLQYCTPFKSQAQYPGANNYIFLPNRGYLSPRTIGLRAHVGEAIVHTGRKNEHQMALPCLIG